MEGSPQRSLLSRCRQCWEVCVVPPPKPPALQPSKTQHEKTRRDSSLNCDGAPTAGREPGQQEVTVFLEYRADQTCSSGPTCTLACACVSLPFRLLLCFCYICPQFLSLKQYRGHFQRTDEGHVPECITAPSLVTCTSPITKHPQLLNAHNHGKPCPV